MRLARLAGKLSCLEALLRSITAFSADRVVVVSNSTAALDIAGNLCRCTLESWCCFNAPAWYTATRTACLGSG